MTESDWIKLLGSILGLIWILLGVIGGWVARSFEKLVDSIDKLNINVAVIVEKVNSHEKRIELLEKSK